MVLLADCGSTKCDWALLQSATDIQRFSTKGYNPALTIQPEFFPPLFQRLASYKQKLNTLVFYGAGIFNVAIAQQLKIIFRKEFPDLIQLQLESDLEGIAKLLFVDEPVYCCILGTGSNALKYDGKEMYYGIPALGYILGDEGSGAYFGKLLVNAFFYKKLPQFIYQDFDEKYHLNKTELIEKVYQGKHGNAYLASFVPFLLEHSRDPYILDFIKSGFRAFLKNHVIALHPKKGDAIHFMGSVAFHFHKQLEAVLSEFGFEMGRLIKSPLDLMIEQWQMKLSK